MRTIDIARLCPKARITAVDVYLPFLTSVKKRVKTAGVPDRVRTVQVSIDDLPFSSPSFDLIWAEGSIFILGVDQSITLWKKFLKPGGCLGFSESTSFTKSPSENVRSFWQEKYPLMKTIDENKTLASWAGYTCSADFLLPASAWWVDYYSPLLSRLSALERQYRGNAEAEAIFSLTRQEIKLFAEHSVEYGYQFFLLKNKQ
jgi:ubiquinone/menaquinone biosynthesis C-methylase UbiE